MRDEYIKLRPDDFLYGCRSGIQKAIRRGDLPLAKHCFDALWANKTQRAWLKWRTTAIVQEEISYYLGELAEFFRSGADSEEDWRKLFYELTLSPKNKDGFSLCFLARDGYDGASHQELSLAMEFITTKSLDPSDSVESCVSKILGMRKFSPYEENAIDLLRRRVGMGGMLGDRQACLTSMIFIALRGLNRAEVREKVEERTRRWSRGEWSNIQPFPARTLPWYVMDMHTVVGKIALSILGKKISNFGLSSARDLSQVWFVFSSAFVPRQMMSYQPIKSRPTAFESIWTIPEIKNSLKNIGSFSPKDLKRLWDGSLSEEVKSVVKWVARKREREV